MKSVFIGIVIISMLIHSVLMVGPFFWPYLYSDEEFMLLTWHGYGASFDMNGLTPFLFYSAYIVISLSLIKQIWWSKSAFLFLTIVSVVSAPFWGFSVTAPYEGALVTMLGLADGAILAMLFFTSVGVDYVRHA